jgi:hypothetical protein
VAVFFAVWYGFLFVMNGTYQEAEQAIHWPTIVSTILESRVQSRTSSSHPPRSGLFLSFSIGLPAIDEDPHLGTLDKNAIAALAGRGRMEGTHIA